VRRYWESPDEPVRYSPLLGNAGNEVAQHPPLYYALMALPYALTGWASPGARWLVLRLCSALLACGSVVFWWKLLRLVESAAARRTVLLGGVALVFFPSCWFDVARVGNDALVALLSSAAFYFAIRSDRNRQERIADHLAVAIVLGLGLWTKAFFLPFYLGTIVWYVWRSARCRAAPGCGGWPCWSSCRF
jgi:hypothetical protein